jgi:hypothetical protein
MAALLVLPLLLMGLLFADSLGRVNKQTDPAEEWMRVLDLSAPAFWPSGTLLRQPEWRSPAVDLRFSPLIPMDADVLTITPTATNEH